ncbi:amidohydrolase family protein [Arenibacter algicola]|uniref:amidohydrolase family protein n=1 Tax=Arenibacter algicola TaxID=616991 RepID=UPI001C078CFD|nr:amidohydrolase family protein [Arenibacter algicola]MBU2904084.1 amidohydrolase family protein [Arenibacter algicola]
MNRKKFLTSASIFTIASLTGSHLLNAEILESKKLLPIIDTHQHLWDVKRFKEDWSKPPIPGNYSMEEYLAATIGLNVVKTVYMEVAVPPNQRHKEALYAIELCKDKLNPMAAAVIAVDPNRDDFAEYMSEFEDSPYIKGIRYFFKSQEEILKEQIINNIRVLGQMGKHFEFSIPVKWLPSMTELVNLCPDTLFFVQHCGNVDPKAFFKPNELLDKPDHEAEQWIIDMKVIASKVNVVCKISGVITHAPGYSLTAENLAPSINQCIDIFGPDRVMFASDWPVCLKSMEMENWVNILKRIVWKRSYVDQKKLFYDNAVNYYNI